jgi:hypothetical protein
MCFFAISGVSHRSTPPPPLSEVDVAAAVEKVGRRKCYLFIVMMRGGGSCQDLFYLFFLLGRYQFALMFITVSMAAGTLV